MTFIFGAFGTCLLVVKCWLMWIIAGKLDKVLNNLAK
jgi:hypothetical protein